MLHTGPLRTPIRRTWGVPLSLPGVWPVKWCLSVFVCILQPHSDLCLFVHARRVLHHHSVFLVEGDRHHAGELPAPLHPQVPPQTLLPTQLLQADVIRTEKEPHLRWENKQKGVPVFIQQSLRLDQRIKHRFLPLSFVLKSSTWKWERRDSFVGDSLFTVLKSSVACYMCLMQKLMISLCGEHLHWVRIMNIKVSYLACMY